MARELVFGPPGTGKTTTLLGLVEEELERGTPPDRIAYVSFTKRAAAEAIHRAAERFALQQSDFPYFKTLHSLCFRALGLKSADVLQGKRLKEFGDLIGIPVSEHISLEEGGSFGFEKGDRILFMENLSRVRCIPLRKQYDSYDDDLSWWEVDRVSTALRRYKEQRNMLDYTDMLALFIERGFQPRIDVLFVDEAQDLSPLQWKVVNKLASTARRVIVAGDDDQAIYRWAGADVEHLINMEGDARVLQQSWRVPKAIQRVADGVISRVRHRRPKVWNPRPDEGRVDWLADFEEVDLSADESILVLARNNILLRGIEKEIRSSGYLYEYRGSRSVHADTVAAILSWTALTRGESITIQDARKMYESMGSRSRIKYGHKALPGYGDEETVDMQSLRDRGGLMVEGTPPWFEALDKLTDFEKQYVRAVLRRNKAALRKAPNIRLSTIHGMKGGEASKVVLLTDMAQRTHQEMHESPEDECRVWYVATTRARNTLQIIKPKTHRHFEFA